ncbi:DUF3472 domain-containing protein [Sunxiuqinia dokdonensis]|uniref:DUF5077 domain-containing protein n=1 Tax=Sunxiuqinia dokdonensis TaxID=1409788 RepID=A0A0L8V776_9BACT|nr:DUF3472 domain-containing protein [Sunxiuqinia dokdonensis]KOH44062.1 hypothetical protein NC99_30550 [Sunxiuqinia dokdonensis]
MKIERFSQVLLVALLVFILQTGAGQSKVHAQVFIPTAGNSWVIDNGFQTTEKIDEGGIRVDSDFTKTFRTFFYAEKTGAIRLGIRGAAAGGDARIKLTMGAREKTIDLTSEASTVLWAGGFIIENPGYQYVDISAVGGEGTAIVHDIAVMGEPAESDFYFMKDEFYWGRRGPSVHLRYLVPEDEKEVTYFYNEITVPEGEDVMGSYFMANGFGQGYFGIQVNSETERRILFSVWSPFHTDNPDEIPEDQRIQLIRKGTGVYTGEFGNEGSGGQSYKRFMWKTETTYGFLLKAVPGDDHSTEFTAWFFDPEVGDWALIASFSRPKTSTYLTGLHSFLENFIPQAGLFDRKVLYTNQWIVDADGNWMELNQAAFSADATARKNARLDYTGGQLNDAFYLKNCGFINEKTTIGTQFTREANNQRPQIDFDALP